LLVSLYILANLCIFTPPFLSQRQGVSSLNKRDATDRPAVVEGSSYFTLEDLKHSAEVLGRSTSVDLESQSRP